MFGKFFNNVRINFIAMSVTFGNIFGAIRLVCNSAFFKHARIFSESHGSSVFSAGYFFFLFWHKVNDRMLGIGFYLSSMSIGDISNVSSIFYYHKLHAITKTEIRNLVFTNKLNGLDNPFYSPAPKTARNQYSIILA